jgi:PIN domain nuclease of toxin-antitoxin system
LEIPAALLVSNVQLLTIEAPHVLAVVHPEPDTRDPFDRLLLAQCQVEGLRLVTTDRVLAIHPLAWQPA